MYELTRQWIQKNLDNPSVVWTDRQREMLEGIITYTEDIGDEFDNAADGMTNPGPPPEPITDLPDDNEP
jgi:hypothetical protein